MSRSISTSFAILPIAQRDAWESLGSRFSGEHAKFDMNDLFAMAGVVVAGLALVWLLRWVYGLQQARRFSNQPRHLFIDICRAHRLRRGDRKRLLALAEYHVLTNPSTLFVRPDLFSQDNLPDDERSVAEYERLHTRLFAGLIASEPDAKPLHANATETASNVVPVTTQPVSTSTPLNV